MIFEHEINLQVSILFGRFCLIPNMKYQLRNGRNNLRFQVCDISKKREGGNFILKVNTNWWSFHQFVFTVEVCPEDKLFPVVLF